MQRLTQVVIGMLVTCTIGCAAAIPDDIHEALGVDYADYRVAEIPADERSRRHSPEAFNGDVVMADVNADGIDDLAALLVRAATDADQQRMPDRHRNLYNTVELVVICNGTVAPASYRCTTIVGPQLGGIYGELDVVHWPDGWAGTTEANRNAACAAHAETPEDQKILSLQQPLGHCDTFFFPLPDGGYDECTYCAD